MPSGRLWNKIARRHYHKQLDLHLARHASTAPRVPCRGVHVIPFAARSCDVKGSRRVSRERAGTTPVCCEKARLRSHQRRRPSARRPRTNRWSPRTLPAFGQPQVLNRCDDREECERANKPYEPSRKPHGCCLPGLAGLASRARSQSHAMRTPATFSEGRGGSSQRG